MERKQHTQHSIHHNHMRQTQLSLLARWSIWRSEGLSHWSQVIQFCVGDCKLCPPPGAKDWDKGFGITGLGLGAERRLFVTYQTTWENPHQGDILNKAASASTAPALCWDPISETECWMKHVDPEAKQCLPFHLRRDQSPKQAGKGTTFPSYPQPPGRGTLGPQRSPSKGRAILSPKCSRGPWALTSPGYLCAFQQQSPEDTRPWPGGEGQGLVSSSSSSLMMLWPAGVWVVATPLTWWSWRKPEAVLWAAVPLIHCPNMSFVSLFLHL